MKDHTPLELAAALRGAAEFCVDPNAPKCRGVAATQADNQHVVPANDPTAALWCAIGRLAYLLDEPVADIHCTALGDQFIELGPVAEAFDNGYHWEAHYLLRDAARQLEALIPTLQEAHA